MPTHGDDDGDDDDDGDNNNETVPTTYTCRSSVIINHDTYYNTRPTINQIKCRRPLP